MSYDNEHSDFDKLVEAGEENEIKRAEKKAEKEAKKEAKKRAKELKKAEKLGFTAEMLGEEYVNAAKYEEIQKKAEEKISLKKKEEKAEDKDTADYDNKPFSPDKAEEAGKSEAAEAEKDKKSDTSEAKADEADEDDSESEENAEDDKASKKKSKKDKKKKPERDPNFNIVKELLNIIVYMGILILVCFCLRQFVGMKVVVSGSSMNNTLHDGDNLWIDKLIYKISDPKRFDIVVFPYDESTETYYIKRIIGLPGERVKIVNGDILINGEKLIEDYGMEVIMDPGIASSEVYLGHDEYFVLGDNRNKSNDSRRSNVGNIKRDEITGKAVIRLTPFSKFGKITKQGLEE